MTLVPGQAVTMFGHLCYHLLQADMSSYIRDTFHSWVEPNSLNVTDTFTFRDLPVRHFYSVGYNFFTLSFSLVHWFCNVTCCLTCSHCHSLTHTVIYSFWWFRPLLHRHWKPLTLSQLKFSLFWSCVLNFCATSVSLIHSLSLLYVH